MNKHLITLATAVLLICVGLSGCLEFTSTTEESSDDIIQDESELDLIIQQAKPYLDKIEVNNLELRTYANSIIKDCYDTECQINAIYRHIVENFNYVSDPRDTELIQTPWETIDVKGGDCEDLSILLNSLLENIGFKTYLVLTDTHAYSLVYDVDVNNLWDYVEQSLIEQVEEDYGDTIRQTYDQSFVLEGYHSWYYGGNGESIGDYFDYLDISYEIESTSPLHLYVLPSKNDFQLYNDGQTFNHYPNWEEENVLTVKNVFSHSDKKCGIMLTNEHDDDTTVDVKIEFYYHPSFYNLFEGETITYYTIEGKKCIVMECTSGVYGYPGYDGGIIGEKIAIDPVTLEYHYLE